MRLAVVFGAIGGPMSFWGGLRTGAVGLADPEVATWVALSVEYALVMPLLGAFTGFLVGWAATPVNPARVRRDISVRTADILITAAGPISNVLLGIVSVGLYAAFVALSAQGMAWALPLLELSRMLVVANVLLAVFNMMPIPPLDGFGIIRAYPRGGGAAVRFLEQYSFIILVVIVVQGGVIFTPIFRVVGQVLAMVRHAVLGA